MDNFDLKTQTVISLGLSNKLTLTDTMKKSLFIIAAFVCIFGYRKVYAENTTTGGATKADIEALLTSFFNDSSKMIFTSDARINLMGMMVVSSLFRVTPPNLNRFLIVNVIFCHLRSNKF